jgi:hypothetical protein
VTRDEKLLFKAPEILESFDLQLLSPVEFISRLDSIEREQEYYPSRLGASSIVKKRLESSEVTRFIQSFRRHPYEKINNFRALIDACLVEPKNTLVQVAFDTNGEMAASIATNHQSPHLIRIPILRINTPPLAKTILRHLLMKAIVDAAQIDAHSIHVVDLHLTHEVTDALTEMGFGLTADGWVKPIVRGFHNLASARQNLEGMGLVWGESACHSTIDQLCTLIWPGKLVSEQITPYLIPIQSQWAEHFFDIKPTFQRLPGLSGINDELHLGVEAVYFTASPISIKPPGHILWYVSSGNEGLGPQQVKATSRLREVVRGTPKELFSRFRRLGIYQWKDILVTAKGDPQAQLTALRFSHTENFLQPMDCNFLRDCQVFPPYPGPRPISFSSFQKIYRNGTQTIS